MKKNHKSLVLLFDWKLWLALSTALLVPRIYEANRVWLVGNMDLTVLALVEQYRFIELAVEVLNESLPFAVLALAAQTATRRELASVLRPVVLFMGGVAGLLTLGIWGMTDLLVDSIGTDQAIVDVTMRYLRVRSLTFCGE